MRCSVVSESSFTPSLSFVPPSWRDEETGTIVSTLRLAFLRFPFSEIPRTKSWTFWIASSGVHRLLSVQTEEEISFGCASKPRRSLLRLESITMSAMLNKKNSVNRFIFWLLFDCSYSNRFSDTPPVSQYGLRIVFVIKDDSTPCGLCWGQRIDQVRRTRSSDLSYDCTLCIIVHYDISLFIEQLVAPIHRRTCHSQEREEVSSVLALSLLFWLIRLTPHRSQRIRYSRQK